MRIGGLGESVHTDSPSPPRFAITGTGRCGTGHVARVLRVCDVNCGHEQWWTPLSRRRRSGLQGDSSWLALPDIEMGTWRGPVLHITRHPGDVVRSLHGIGFFTGGARREFTAFALTHEPELANMPSVEAAVEWWARWNARCAAVADLTIRVEDLPDRLGDVLTVIGQLRRVHRAPDIPTTVNHRRRAEIDDRMIWRLLAGRAEVFGYQEV